ncbi:MAG: BBE domain-containing protein [Solirubrobacterales bacterium]
MRFLHLPPLPQVPEPLQDQPLITIGACYAGPEADGAELIQPIRELGEPVMDMLETMPPSRLPAVHLEPDEPVPGFVYTTSLREAPEPWSTGSCYFNFADRPTDLEAIFAPETLERLRDVKRRYDPDGLISGNHNVALA